MGLTSTLRHGCTLHGLSAGLCVFAAAWLVGLGPGSAAMLGWCAHVATYAGLLLHRLGRAEPETMRRRAQRMAEGRATILALSLIAAAASLLAVVLQLASGGAHWPGQVLGVATILFSWFYMQLLFAQDYAHEYWMQEQGVVFPGGDGTPEFSEFLYLAFTIGMTFQVSDVTTDSPRMRRIVQLHALVAFGFNAVILAAAVNIVAGLGK